MNHAEKCPVCKGAGKLPRAPTTSSMTDIVDCHGCRGIGWVTVSDDSGKEKIKVISLKPRNAKPQDCPTSERRW